MNDSHRGIDDSEMIALSRRYASMSDSDRAAFRATIDADTACGFAFFASRIGESLESPSLSDIECALIAAGLADGRCDDYRDVFIAVDELRHAIERQGESAHLFIERVAPLFPADTSKMLRSRFGRRLGRIRFLDAAGADFPQHPVFAPLFENPRLIFRLLFAVEAALEVHIARHDLRAVWRAVWTEMRCTDPNTLTTSNPSVRFEVLLDAYRGEIVVRLIYSQSKSVWQRWIRRRAGGRASERFRTVIEGFTAAYTPLAMPNTDRLTMFKRSTQGIFDWRRHKPVLKNR
jgi:hypothetical protein